MKFQTCAVERAADRQLEDRLLLPTSTDSQPGDPSQTGDPSPPLRVLIVQPDPLDEPHRLANWLTADGAVVTAMQPFSGDPIPDSPGDADALVVLGGSMGANDKEEFPWLRDIEVLLRATTAAGKPILGICLGAQLLATAFGGTVRRGDHGLESGVSQIEWSQDTHTDPVFGGLPQPFLAGGMHVDAITELPTGAELLGSNPIYPVQAFRLGCAWGVQFHPELSPALFRKWRGEVGEEQRAEFDRQAAEFDTLDAAVRPGNFELVRNFIAVVRAYRHEAMGP